MGSSKRSAAFLIGSTVVVCGLLAGIASAANPQPPGQAKQQDAAAANAQPPTADNSTGVKPSSTTQHQTSATAGSNKTKLYGNGKTAGQIAMHNGASSNTPLYGPGNSQPHKVAVCTKGKTHYVDVHALKSHRAGACTTSAAAPASNSTAPATAAPTVATPASNSTARATAAPTVAAPASNATVPTTASMSHAFDSHGVLGAQATIGASALGQAARPSAGGVKGAYFTQVTHAAPPAHAVLAAATFTG